MALLFKIWQALFLFILFSLLNASVQEGGKNESLGNVERMPLSGTIVPDQKTNQSSSILVARSKSTSPRQPLPRKVLTTRSGSDQEIIPSQRLVSSRLPITPPPPPPFPRPLARTSLPTTPSTSEEDLLQKYSKKVTPSSSRMVTPSSSNDDLTLARMLTTSKITYSPSLSSTKLQNFTSSKPDNYSPTTSPSKGPNSIIRRDHRSTLSIPPPPLPPRVHYPASSTGVLSSYDRSTLPPNLPPPPTSPGPEMQSRIQSQSSPLSFCSIESPVSIFTPNESSSSSPSTEILFSAQNSSSPTSDLLDSDNNKRSTPPSSDTMVIDQSSLVQILEPSREKSTMRQSPESRSRSSSPPKIKLIPLLDPLIEHPPSKTSMIDGSLESSPDYSRSPTPDFSSPPGSRPPSPSYQKRSLSQRIASSLFPQQKEDWFDDDKFEERNDRLKKIKRRLEKGLPGYKEKRKRKRQKNWELYMKQQELKREKENSRDPAGENVIKSQQTPSDKIDKNQDSSSSSFNDGKVIISRTNQKDFKDISKPVPLKKTESTESTNSFSEDTSKLDSVHSDSSKPELPYDLNDENSKIPRSNSNSNNSMEESKTKINEEITKKEYGEIPGKGTSRIEAGNATTYTVKGHGTELSAHKNPPHAPKSKKVSSLQVRFWKSIRDVTVSPSKKKADKKKETHKRQSSEEFGDTNHLLSNSERSPTRTPPPPNRALSRSLPGSTGTLSESTRSLSRSRTDSPTVTDVATVFDFEILPQHSIRQKIRPSSDNHENTPINRIKYVDRNSPIEGLEAGVTPSSRPGLPILNQSKKEKRGLGKFLWHLSGSRQPFVKITPSAQTPSPENGSDSFRNPPSPKDIKKYMNSHVIYEKTNHGNPSPRPSSKRIQLDVHAKKPFSIFTFEHGRLGNLKQSLRNLGARTTRSSPSNSPTTISRRRGGLIQIPSQSLDQPRSKSHTSQTKSSKSLPSSPAKQTRVIDSSRRSSLPLPEITGQSSSSSFKRVEKMDFPTPPSSQASSKSSSPQGSPSAGNSPITRGRLLSHQNTVLDSVIETEEPNQIQLNGDGDFLPELHPHTQPKNLSEVSVASSNSDLRFSPITPKLVDFGQSLSTSTSSSSTDPSPNTSPPLTINTGTNIDSPPASEIHIISTNSTSPASSTIIAPSKDFKMTLRQIIDGINQLDVSAKAGGSRSAPRQPSSVRSFYDSTDGVTVYLRGNTKDYHERHHDHDSEEEDYSEKVHEESSSSSSS